MFPDHSTIASKVDKSLAHKKLSCLNSIDADGMKEGYEINLTKLISENVNIPVIASGGAGVPQHLCEVFSKGKADAALIASMVHYGTYSIKEIKEYLAKNKIKVRLQ